MNDLPIWDQLLHRIDSDDLIGLPRCLEGGAGAGGVRRTAKRG